MGQRKIPIRTCVGCRATSQKCELTRIVRTTAGEVSIDPTGKVAGRGAYLCSAKECFATAIKHNKLGRALKCAIPQCVVAELENLVVEDDADK